MNKILRAALLFSLALSVSSCVCGNSGSGIPSDKKDVIDRFLAGTLDPSYTPALFFGSFGAEKMSGNAAVQAHLEFYLKGGSDILKVQTEQQMPYIEELTMDTPLVPEDYYRPTLEVVKKIQETVGKDVYVMPTILSPYQVARQGMGDDRLPGFAKTKAAEYRRMLDSYTQAIFWYIRECKAAGIEAFFTASQGGEMKYYDVDIEGGFFETCVRPYDLIVMNEAAKDSKFTILHICDWEGPMDDLTRYLEYPGKIVSVPLALDGKAIPLKEVYEMFGRPVEGGFNRKAEMVTESPEKIADMARELIASGPKGRMILGADCSVPSPLDATDNVHAAVSAAHGR